MGVTHRAVDLQAPAQQFALKVISSEFSTQPAYQERLAGEMRAASKIEHCNLARVCYTGITDDLIIVSKLIPGSDLGQQLKSVQRYSLQQTLHIGAQIAAGLEALHQAGLVHGNLKPRNVRLDERVGNKAAVYLTDFGLARFSTGAPGVTSSAFAGGLPYCSPEVFQGEPPSSGSDVYALACLMVQCLTGRVPFSGPGYRTYSAQHQNTPPPQLAELAPGLPTGLDDVISRGLEKDPGLRPSSPTSWMRALERAAEKIGSPRAGAPARSRRHAAPPRPHDAISLAETAGPLAPGTAAPLLTATTARPVAPKPVAAEQVNRSRTVLFPARRYAKPRVKTRPPRRPPKWAAGVGLIAALTVTAGFVDGPTHHSLAKSGKVLSGTTSKSGSAVTTAASTAQLTVNANRKELALFNRVSNYNLGHCKPRAEAPFIRKGWVAALTCKPTDAPLDAIIVRQFRNTASANADAKARVSGAGPAKGPRKVCTPAGNPTMTSSGVSVVAVFPRAKVAPGSGVSCYADRGNHIFVWVYESSGVEMALLRSRAVSTVSGRLLTDWLDANLQHYLLRPAG
jgi:hypothetical protein